MDVDLAARGRSPDALEEARAAARNARVAPNDLWDGTAELLRAARGTSFMEDTATALA